MANQLKSEIISGSRWLILNQAINQPIRIIVGILLMRLLLPEDFGLVAKSFAVTGIAELVLVQGLLGAVIQDKEIEERQIHTLFWVSFLWSIFIAATIFLFATTIAQFYGDDKVAWIVRIASISIVFSGMQLVPSALIRKKLRFKKIFIAATTSGVVSSALAIYFTLRGYGYQALIYQFVINSILNGLIIFKMSNWIPKFEFNLKEVNSHIQFGLNMMGSNILNYLVRNTDDIALGKFQSNVILGQYSRAYFLMLTPLNMVNQIFNALLFPLFSSIQDDKKKMTEIFLMAQEIILITMFPMTILFFFNAEIIIKSILGTQWISSVHIFRIFIPLLLIQLFTSPISSVYASLGKVGSLFRFNLITTPILIICIIVAAQHSAIYVANTIVIFTGITSLIVYINGLTYLKINFFSQNIVKLKLLFTVFFLYAVVGWIINPILQLTEMNTLLVSFGEIVILYSVVYYKRPQLLNYLKLMFKLK